MPWPSLARVSVSTPGLVKDDQIGDDLPSAGWVLGPPGGLAHALLTSKTRRSVGKTGEARPDRHGPRWSHGCALHGRGVRLSWPSCRVWANALTSPDSNRSPRSALPSSEDRPSGQGTRTIRFFSFTGSGRSGISRAVLEADPAGEAAAGGTDL